MDFATHQYGMIADRAGLVYHDSVLLVSQDRAINSVFEKKVANLIIAHTLAQVEDFVKEYEKFDKVIVICGSNFTAEACCAAIKNLSLCSQSTLYVHQMRNSSKKYKEWAEGYVDFGDTEDPKKNYSWPYFNYGKEPWEDNYNLLATDPGQGVV